MLIKPCNFNIYLETLKFMYHALKISNGNIIFNFAGEEKRKEEFYNSRGFETQKKGQVLGMHSYRILNISMENECSTEKYMIILTSYLQLEL